MPIIDQGNNPLLPGFNTGTMLGFAGLDLAATQIYGMMPESVRTADSQQGNLLLKRFLSSFQIAWDRMDDRIAALSWLISIQKCPDELLCYMALQLGWTSEYDNLICDLNPVILRRLLANSIALWKIKGSWPGVEAIVNVVFGLGVRIWDWFYYRWVSDENILGEDRDGLDVWNIALPQDGSDEYRSTLRIVDDGMLPRAKILGFLEIFRPVKEVFEVAWIGYLERFRSLGDDSQVASVDIVNLPARIGNGVVLLDAAAYESVYASPLRLRAWDYAQYYVGIRAFSGGLGGIPRFGALFRYEDDLNHWKVDLNAETSVASLIAVVGGVPTVQQTFDFDTIDERIHLETWYGIRITIQQAEAGGLFRHIKVWIDQALRLEFVSILRAGTFGVYADIDVAAECRELEGFELPLDVDEIAPTS